MVIKRLREQTGISEDIKALFFKEGEYTLSDDNLRALLEEGFKFQHNEGECLEWSDYPYILSKQIGWDRVGDEVYAHIAQGVIGIYCTDNWAFLNTRWYWKDEVEFETLYNSLSQYVVSITTEGVSDITTQELENVAGTYTFAVYERGYKHINTAIDHWCFDAENSFEAHKRAEARKDQYKIPVEYALESVEPLG